MSGLPLTANVRMNGGFCGYGPRAAPKGTSRHSPFRRLCCQLLATVRPCGFSKHKPMAAADSSSSPFYIPILVATLPVILSPILAWVLGRSGISREAATIDYLNKRLDVLERLNKLHTQITEGPMRPLLEAEVEHYQKFLSLRPTFITYGTELDEAESQSRWAKFFLTQPATSTRKRVFKGLFYLFLELQCFRCHLEWQCSYLPNRAEMI
jgi:hypothetical protein